MKQINFRLSDVELQHLQKFCELTERQQTDVLRQSVRKLSVSGMLSSIDSLEESVYPNVDSLSKAQGL